MAPGGWFEASCGRDVWRLQADDDTDSSPCNHSGEDIGEVITDRDRVKQRRDEVAQESITHTAEGAVSGVRPSLRSEHQGATAPEGGGGGEWRLGIWIQIECEWGE